MVPRRSVSSASSLVSERIDVVVEGRSVASGSPVGSRRIDVVIARLCEPLHGNVTRSMLLDAGVTASAIDHRVRVGRLHPEYPGVYSVGHRPLTPEALTMAAVLACGSGAVLSHVSAAAHLSLLAASPGEPDVLRAGSRRDGPAGVRVHRTTHLPSHEHTIHRGVPVTSPARTLLDLAATGRIGRLETATEEAQARRLVTRRQLDGLAASGRRGATALRAVLADHSGYTRQGAERLLKELIIRAQLPKPDLNARVGGHDADAVWPQHRLIVEVDGYAAHGRRHAFERDRLIDQQRAAAGWLPLRVTWRQLNAEPEAVVARLAGALARSGWSGRP